MPARYQRSGRGDAVGSGPLTGTDQSAVDGMLLTLRPAANPRAAAIMRDSIERNYQSRPADALPGTDATSRAALDAVAKAPDR